MSEITKLLTLAAQGENESVQQLMPLIYDRLRTIASRQLAKEQHNSLATTGLVHEAYLELFGNESIHWKDRGHFFAYAARAMRNILIDRARQRLALKRNPQAGSVDLTDIDLKTDDDSMGLLALDQALNDIAHQHPRLVQVIEMRFFAGLSVEEVAQALGVTSRSVERDWQKARAIINQALHQT